MNTVQSLPFMKMSGTGNDFILIDHREPRIAVDEMSEFVRLVCRRKFSVGADGLIFIESSDEADFKWRFFNGDGSVAEMCGNGARCAARYAYLRGLAPAEMRFETLAGIIEAKVEDVQVSLRMTRPRNFHLGRNLDANGQNVEVHFVDTGVPHAVLFVDDIKAAEVKKMGAAIRFHEVFMPAGTNVNFAWKQSDSVLRVRTYERGVEAETFACGTGAVASALIAARLDRAMNSPVEVITSGGDRLTILFDMGEGGEAENVFLKGPAHVIYQGEFGSEALVE